MAPKASQREPMSDAELQLPIADAHHHIWDLALKAHPWLRDEPMRPFRYGDTSAIRKTYLPADYRRDSRRFNVVKTVYVEAEWDSSDPVGESRWVHEMAAQHGLPNAMVAQARLDRDDASAVLEQQAAFPLVKSVRHKPRSAIQRSDARRGAPGSMDCPRWRKGFAMLANHRLHFDLQTPWWHFDAASDLARDFPCTTIIVNHTGLPADRNPQGLASWRNAMELLATQANVMLKISGLGMPGHPWTEELQGPVVRDAIRIFGVERTMFASNFPVDSLVATFDEVYNSFMAITREMPAWARGKLFHDNAVRIYGL